MIHNSTTKALTIFVLSLALSAVDIPVQAGEITSSYLYHLSNFSGTIPSMWAKISVDTERNEIYVLDVREKDVRIFNEQGMEIFSFGSDLDVGYIQDVAIGQDGDILLLTGFRTDFAVTRCNYRGEPQSRIEITGLPVEFSGLSADKILYIQDRLFLADMGAAKIIVVGLSGEFERGYDLFPLIESTLSPEDKKKYAKKKKEERADDYSLGGFSVDTEGNLFFTTPSLFTAYILSPDGELQWFGIPGSSRGKFGVVSGIAADDKGYLYVTDKLRSVVIIFDRDLKVVNEFGFRGYGPENLIVPNDLALDAKGRVYVSQAANRGVSVFQIEERLSSMTEQGDLSL